ncbi:Outer membrane protein TolC [Granulicella pectinivorans]|uniref:Outer membrane protein TolC n=1 Tax=Granulicella pectinivorans TaxID=474950 RepID=A0A1I6L4L9_9BACT|nr:TolC family protein [Granulicella pectinivorans]SFR98433.1 Outer membrane protein TolC [Granulicella pectinivorans]
MKPLILILLFFVASGLPAQTPTVSLANPASPALPPAVLLEVAPRVGITSEVDLTLSDMIQAVLANNRDIEVARLSRLKASLNLHVAKGYFDPVVGGNAYSLRQVSPVTSSLGGGTNGAVTQKEIFADPQISGNSRWLGTTYKLDFSSSRVNSSNTYNTLNPTYPTAATLNLTQPLWGGLLFDQNRERLSVARRNVAQTEEQFRQHIIDVTTQGVHAYLELDYALRNLNVQIEAVRLAEKQDASNRRQVEQGTQAPVDVIQTQTQMSTYQQNVFNAQQQVTQAENTLKALMLPNRADPLWNAALKTSIHADQATPIPTLAEALSQALSERPDLKAGQIAVQVSGLDARLAKEQTKPQVNLTAQVGTQGLSGENVAQSSDLLGSLFAPLFTRVNDLSTLAGLPALPTTGSGSTTSVPGFFLGGYGQSLQNLRDGRFPTVKIGLQVSFPIANRTARAQEQIAKANVKQATTQQQQLEMTVESEVRNSLQRLTNADLLLNAAQRTAQLAQQQYESEQRQFKAGTSSVFLILQRQTELINAKLREIRASADRGEAEADFDQATANTLHRQNIDIVAEARKKP